MPEPEHTAGPCNLPTPHDCQALRQRAESAETEIKWLRRALEQAANEIERRDRNLTSRIRAFLGKS